MSTTTTNYSLIKPGVNDPTDQDLWGGYLNDDLDDIDALMKQAMNWVFSAKTGTYAVLAADINKFITGDATGGAFDFDLPSAASVGSGFAVGLKKIDSSANAITIDPDGADTVERATLPLQDDSVILVSDGVSAWRVLAERKTTLTPGRYLQILSSAISATTLTSTFPSGNTAITSSDGSSVWSQAITPSATSSLVEISGTINISVSASGVGASVALFRGTTLLDVIPYLTIEANTTYGFKIPINFMDSPNTTSATTYSLRVGKRNGDGGTVYVASTLTPLFDGQLALNQMCVREINQ